VEVGIQALLLPDITVPPFAARIHCVDADRGTWQLNPLPTAEVPAKLLFACTLSPFCSFSYIAFRLHPLPFAAFSATLPSPEPVPSDAV